MQVRHAPALQPSVTWLSPSQVREAQCYLVITPYRYAMRQHWGAAAAFIRAAREGGGRRLAPILRIAFLTMTVLA